MNTQEAERYVNPYQIHSTPEGWEIIERGQNWDVKYASYDEAYDALRSILRAVTGAGVIYAKLNETDANRDS
jgi:hypothetical protein